MNIPESIRETTQTLLNGQECVVGVSGGMDSVALLHALHQLEIPLTVAHLNHQLRGEASDADENFVRELAQELGFPIKVKSVDVRRLAEDTNLSLEMTARQARHEFFAECNPAIIALAHHADDQVETFMLKLARGAGTDGLSGMAVTQTLGSLHIIRPFLTLPRAEILQWMNDKDYTWREDASNQDPAFLRNRVRNGILPLLEEQLNPGIRETILRTMNILREENAWMESLLTNANIGNLSDIPLAARRRVLRNWLFDQGATDVDFHLIDTLLTQMENTQGTSYFDLNAGQRIVIEYGKLRYEPTASAQPVKQQWMLHLENGTGWKKDHGKGAGLLPAEASFDAGKVGDAPIQVRSMQPGDRMKPFGMTGSRKLQDIFTDLKIPRTRRGDIPVVLCRGEIIWIPGYRTAHGWQVEGNSGKSIHIRIEQNGTN